MKKLLFYLLTLILVFNMFACGTGTGSDEESKPAAATDPVEDPNGLKVGFGRESIVPDVNGVQIAGGDASARISDGYRDEVATTCISIREGDETILLYTVDLITVDLNTYKAQKYIAEATGITEENIILNATHTRSGVSIRSDWDGVGAYCTKFYDACVTAAQQALADLSAATMYFGSTMTENMVFVRHYRMNDGSTYGNGHGTTASGYKEHLYDSDGELQVIKFDRSAGGKKDVVLMNLGAHATMMNSIAPNTISADWPYNARTYVEGNSNSLCAVFEAAAGDQIPNSNITALAPYGNKYPQFGEKIGQYCTDVLNSQMTQATGTGIQLRVHNYTAPSMKEGLDDPTLFSQAVEINSCAMEKGSSHAETTALVAQYGFSSVYEATGLVGRVNHPETFSMELHLMSIDGVSFIFAPFEMFGVTGREIKDTSPYDMTFIITCSENATGYHMGYMPHEYACEEGFYEYDVTKFARGTAEDLAKTYVQLLTEMKGT